MVFSARLINQDECAAGDSAVALKGSCSQGCACESGWGSGIRKDVGGTKAGSSRGGLYELQSSDDAL